MGERWYLRTMSAIGPMYYAGTYLATGEDDSRWSSLRASGVAYESADEARADRDVLLGNSPAVRVVRVGPPRRHTLTARGRAATEPARQGVDGGSDVVTGVPGPTARPTGSQAPAGERQPVTGLWCGDSPVHEHAWQWRDGGLVCAHCGGRRVEVKA